jgi:hypothetical protein
MGEFGPEDRGQRTEDRRQKKMNHRVTESTEEGKHRENQREN